ncbi:MAG: VWA domain-containing protein, partial [Oscillospiraceae bacterium]|nr:VWA domain-containing protein [Oscillospiraceae bacterium]
ADGEAAPAAPPAPGGESDDVVLPGTVPQIPAEPLKLTAAEWKDNDNWPFFTNLVNAGTIAFPSFGLDPRNRIEVRVTSPAAALANETVTLLDAEGAVLWTARTDKNGVAYVFWAEGQTPAKVVCGEATADHRVPEASGDPQGNSAIKPLDTVTLTVEPAAPAQTGMQIMFIVDTTGSMGDEIAYLQKDFSAIAERVGNTGVTWSVNFYRDEGDEYVTRTNGFTSDIADVQAKINAEYADGGGDTPEAVAEILTACLTSRTDWDENSVKLAFLIFDAPPHDGKDAALRAAVNAAAEKGVHLIPVVASNADRETELFGRALAILTGGTYVFLTDDSGIGDSHLEPIVGSYTVELLQDLIVRIIEENRP